MSTFVPMPQEEFEELRPRIAPDVVVRHYDDGMIAWSPTNSAPSSLDGVSAIVFQILDGSGTVAELVKDIHDVVGIPEAIARNQLRNVLDGFVVNGLLEGFEPTDAISTKIDLFPAPPNP